MAAKLADGENEVMQGNRGYLSGAIRILRKTEEQDGLGFGWQVLVFLAALAAVFSRLPGTLLHPQFFAEDGWVWYQQAYNLHWMRSLGITQAGYLQTLPRLVAGVTLLFPMQWAPLIMSLAGAVVQVFPVTALLSRRCTPWGPLPVRMIMGVIYIAIPNAPEIHIVLTNAMWHLAVLQALLALSVPPFGWRGRVSDILLFAVGSVSGPFSILLLPSVAAYYWIRRQRWTLLILSIMSLGIIIQIFCLVRSARHASIAPLGATPVTLLRIVAGRIFFDSMIGSGDSHLTIPMLMLVAMGGFTVLVLGWRGAPLALRLFGIFAIIALAASLKDPLLPGNRPRWEVLADVAGIRYWFLPSLMFLWLAAWAACGGRARVVRCTGGAVLLLTMIGVVRKWTYPPWPDSHFQEEVDRFRTLRPGEHMTFSVYDPASRKMELIKH
jgi:hypothetical protein